MKYPLKRPTKITALFGALIVLLAIFGGVKMFKNSSSIREQRLSLPDALASDDTVEEPEWQDIQTEPGDSLATLFTHMGLSAKTLNEILHDNPHAKMLTQIQPNIVAQFLIHGTELKQLILPISKTQSITVKRINGQFVTQLHVHKTDVKTETVTGTVHHSLFATSRQTHIPYALIQKMADILTWQINFSKDLREGDQFSIHYEVHYVNDERIRTGDILSVSYTNKGKSYQAIRHQTKSGKVDYYTPEGKSVRKAFSRYPLHFSHISSNFSLSRMHPILKRRRPHRGIDLAAPIGTPIHATSDGRVVSIGYDNGYGNKIILSHTGPYQSLYAHLLRFRKGLKRGDFVSRGEIIGYVGQTGLADGPHCHYEFRINNVAQNPATVALPEALSLPTSELAAFKSHVALELAELTRKPKSKKQIT